MIKSNSQVEALKSALSAFRKIYGMLEDQADPDTILEDEDCFPLLEIREALADAGLTHAEIARL